MFGDARDYIPVETLKIVQTVEWILRHQTTEGLFKEPPEGRVIHTDMQVLQFFSTLVTHLGTNYKIKFPRVVHHRELLSLPT